MRKILICLAAFIILGVIFAFSGTNQQTFAACGDCICGSCECAGPGNTCYGLIDTCGNGGSTACVCSCNCGCPSGGGGGGGTCYNTALSDTYTTPNGSCNITITHLGWDNSDNSSVYYADGGTGSRYRTVNINDSDASCKPNINLQFTNDWQASTDQTFSVTNTINSKSAGNNLGSGWQLNSSGCTIIDCTTTQLGPSQRTFNSGSDTWTGLLNYCGNGICSCGETTATCRTDCLLTSPTVTPPASPPSCLTPGNRATVSWNPTSDATYYQIRIDNQTNGWNNDCNNLNTGDFCFSNILTTSYTFSTTPGATYSWWVYGCDTNGVCSIPTKAADFTCALPPCPGGIIGGVNTLAACGGAPLPPQYISPDPRTIGKCDKTWIPDHGPGNAYDIWCATNANPTRSYCYRCDFASTIIPAPNPAWIQIDGDVHSDTGIIAPGGP